MIAAFVALLDQSGDNGMLPSSVGDIVHPSGRVIDGPLEGWKFDKRFYLVGINDYLLLHYHL